MTPEEEAVIDAAITLREYPRNDELDFFYPIVDALIFSCPRCNAGGHTCPGDGNPISHTATDCGQHEVCGARGMVGASGCVRQVGHDGRHGYADGSGEQDVFEVPRRPMEEEYSSLPILDPTSFKVVAVKPDDPVWTPATLVCVLAGDHIRIGADETDVLRSNRGVWNVSKQQMGWKDGAGNWQGEYVKGAAPWFPAEHRVELRLDLSANPGFRKYPADTPCEILCTPERLAVLTLMTVFPGTKEIKP